MSKRLDQIQTLRQRVLAAVQASDRPLTGQEVAQRTGVPYKPVVDALVVLNNQGKVWRLGRKFTAQWTAKPPAHDRALRHLDSLFKP